MMRNLSYIFNSKNISPAVIWTVLVIFACELFWSNLHLKAFNHEVDSLVEQIAQERYNSEIIFIGDSVGGNILQSSDYKKSAKDYAILTSNQIIEMPGNYFLLKRYLMKNLKPKAVIYLGANPLGKNLTQPGVENFVQRVFINLDEIFDLAQYKDMKFVLTMFIYKLLHSYRFRLYLQTQFLGISNAHPYNGVLMLKPWQEEKDERNIWSKLRDSGRRQPISDIYFEKIAGLLRKEGIKFYFINTPVNEQLFFNDMSIKSYEAMQKYLERTAVNDDNFFYFKDLKVYPSRLFMKDMIHLNEEGRCLENIEMEKKMNLIKQQIKIL